MIAKPYLYIFLYSLFTYCLGLNLWAIIKDPKLKLNLPLTLAIAWGLGQGILSFGLFGLALFNQLNIFITNTFLALLCLNTLLAVYLSWKKSVLSLKGWAWVIITIVFFWPFFQHALFSPLTSWDTIAIWFLKAKVIFYEPGLSHNTFFSQPNYWYAHPDYPLGLPLVIAGFYRLIEQVHDQVPKFYLLLYYFNLSLLYIGAINYFLTTKINWLIRLLIYILLITIPNFLIYSLSGYADIPLAFIFALSFFLLIAGVKEKDNKLLVVSGISSIMSAYIKIEGYPFLLLLLAYILIFQKRKTQGIITFLFWLSPVILWELIKIKMGIKGTFAAAHFPMHFLGSIKLVFYTYLDEIINTSRYNLTLIIALAVYLLTLGLVSVKRLFKVLLLNLLPLGQLTSYTIIYLITPYPLSWQLTSFQRIIMHIIPLLFLLIFYNYHYLCQTTKNRTQK